MSVCSRNMVGLIMQIHMQYKIILDKAAIPPENC
jgi:hypothetical protein